MIIRRCIYTGTDTDTFKQYFKSDMDSLGFFISPVENTSGVDGSYYAFFSYPSDSVVGSGSVRLSISSSDRISVDVIDGNGNEMNVATNLNDYYIVYTLIKAGSSFAMAISAETSNDEQHRNTNALTLFITPIGGEYVAVTYNQVMYSGIITNSDISSPHISPSLTWVQLIPLGVPSLHNASSDVYIIRYAPAVRIENTISGQKYLLGDYLAIKLEANND